MPDRHSVGCSPYPAPGPLEAYAARFDGLFLSLAQRRGFREYLTGLLAPRDRNKTLACLAGVEPVLGAGLPSVQRLWYFLSESRWDGERVNARRLELLRTDPAGGRSPEPTWSHSSGQGPGSRTACWPNAPRARSLRRMPR